MTPIEAMKLIDEQLQNLREAWIATVKGYEEWAKASELITLKNIAEILLDTFIDSGIKRSIAKEMIRQIAERGSFEGYNFIVFSKGWGMEPMKLKYLKSDEEVLDTIRKNELVFILNVEEILKG